MNLLLLERDERFLAARDPRALHLRRVLRAGPGDAVRAGEVDGWIGQARLSVVDQDGIRLEFAPEHEPPPLSPVEIVLGHPRPIVLRRLIRDLATIGVSRLLVCPTELGEKSYLDATLWDDVRPLLVEGAAQAGSTLLPRVDRCTRLDDALGRLSSGSQARFVLHAGGGPPLTGLLDRLPLRPVAIAVGSERGWTPSELNRLTGRGFAMADAGPRILRTETAATVAAWAAVSWYTGRGP